MKLSFIKIEQQLYTPATYVVSFFAGQSPKKYGETQVKQR